ncbi:alpha/beta fold hydrolase [Methylobacterium sp. JK268]
MTPLVLLPGLLNDADLFRDQVEALGDVAAPVVGDITRGETIEALAEDVLAAAPPAFALAGFSLGGYVAQEILRRAPDRVTRLALLDTSIRPDAPDRAASREALGRAARAPGRFHGFGDRLLATYVAPAHRGDPAIAGRIRAMTERLGPAVFLRQNGIARKDGRDVLRALACPLLVLCGESDAVTPPAEHREMAALVPGSRLVVVPESGHMTPIEQPEAVSRALRDWLLA